MGILDIFRRGPKEKKQVMTLSGWSAFYSQFGSDIYASDVVQQALKCIVDEMKKLRPQHIIEKGADPVPAKDASLQRLLDAPNPTMTTSEFIEKITWLLLLNYNAFIIPTFYKWTDQKTGEERRRYTALYPIQPASVQFIEDAAGRLFVTFYFGSGYETTIDYRDIIHLKYNFSVSLKTYLFTIGKSRALDWLRANRRRKTEQLPEHIADGHCPEEILIEDEEKRQLYAAISRLRGDYKTAIHLVYFEDLSYKEAGYVMTKSEKQIQNLIYRAKEALREDYRKEGLLQ